MSSFFLSILHWIYFYSPCTPSKNVLILINFHLCFYYIYGHILFFFLLSGIFFAQPIISTAIKFAAAPNLTIFSFALFRCKTVRVPDQFSSNILLNGIYITKREIAGRAFLLKIANKCRLAIFLAKSIYLYDLKRFELWKPANKLWIDLLAHLVRKFSAKRELYIKTNNNFPQVNVAYLQVIAILCEWSRDDP